MKQILAFLFLSTKVIFGILAILAMMSGDYPRAMTLALLALIFQGEQRILESTA